MNRTEESELGGSPSRRQILSGLLGLASIAMSAAVPTARAAATDAERALQAGACVLLLRHAVTVSGIGDPPDFRLDQCATQRNLSDEGRQQSIRLGQWFNRRELKPRAVLSSAWCRCRDTATLAFGDAVVWSALNSTFGDRLRQPDQSAVLRQALARVPAGQFEVWVTHQVNIAALTGEGPSMGEGMIVDARGVLVARTSFD